MPPAKAAAPAAAPWGDAGDDTPLDAAKVQAALAKLRAEAAARAASEYEDAPSERKRKYNSLAAEAEPSLTAEDMEAYRLSKERANDPLAAMRAPEGSEHDLV